MKSLSKEEIKERLIRRAADTWGMDEMEIEYSLDPIVSILFDADFLLQFVLQYK